MCCFGVFGSYSLFVCYWFGWRTYGLSRCADEGCEADFARVVGGHVFMGAVWGLWGQFVGSGGARVTDGGFSGRKSPFNWLALGSRELRHTSGYLVAVMPVFFAFIVGGGFTLPWACATP